MKKVTPSNEWWKKSCAIVRVCVCGRVWKHCNYSSGTIKLAVCTKQCADNTESAAFSGTMDGEWNAGVIETIHIAQTAAKTSNGETSRASQTTWSEEKREQRRKEGKAAKVPKRGKNFPFLTKCRDLGNSQYNMWTNTATHIPITHSCETKKDSSHMCRYGAAGKNSFLFFNTFRSFSQLECSHPRECFAWYSCSFLHFFWVDLCYCLLLSLTSAFCVRVCVSGIV